MIDGEDAKATGGEAREIGTFGYIVDQHRRVRWIVVIENLPCRRFFELAAERCVFAFGIAHQRLAIRRALTENRGRQQIDTGAKWGVRRPLANELVANRAATAKRDLLRCKTAMGGGENDFHR